MMREKKMAISQPRSAYPFKKTTFFYSWESLGFFHRMRIFPPAVRRSSRFYGPTMVMPSVASTLALLLWRYQSLNILTSVDMCTFVSLKASLNRNSWNIMGNLCMKRSKLPNLGNLFYKSTGVPQGWLLFPTLFMLSWSTWWIVEFFLYFLRVQKQHWLEIIFVS